LFLGTAPTLLRIIDDKEDSRLMFEVSQIKPLFFVDRNSQGNP
jgi:hypothetical protein